MTVGGLFSAFPSPSTTATLYSLTPSITHNTPCPNPSFCSSVVNPRRSFEHNNRLSFSDPKSKPTNNFAANLKSIRLRCNSSTGPGGPPGSGEGDSKSVLDAFFLGKALAEALNERIESTVGEFLSAVGRLQAEQQKQVQDFQEDVLERAKRAKEKAAREAMEAQGLIPKSSTADVSAVTNGDTTTSSPAIVPVTPTISPSPSSSSAPNTNINADTGRTEKEPLIGVPDED